MSVGFIAAGVGIAGTVVSYEQAEKAEDKAYAANTYNAKAREAQGQIDAAIVRFDAIGPAFQALMEAEKLDVNSKLFELNSELVKNQGRQRVNEYLLQEKYALAEAAVQGEDLTRDAYEEERNRIRSSDRFDEAASVLKRSGNRQRARLTTAYAAMGVDLDSEALKQIEKDIVQDNDQKLAELAFSRTVEQLASGRRSRDLRRDAERVIEAGDQQATTAAASAKLAEIDTAKNTLSLMIDAADYAQSRDYMKWYAGFLEESAELKASAIESGADLEVDQLFSVRDATASQTKASNIANLTTGLVSSGVDLYKAVKKPGP